jgi:hypothetical protein
MYIALTTRQLGLNNKITIVFKIYNIIIIHLLRMGCSMHVALTTRQPGRGREREKERGDADGLGSTD